MESTIRNVALIFEGGGMRNSYSAGALSVMLDAGLFFDDVYGLSAGATNAIDYVSRDAARAEASFTTCLDDLAFRWWIAPLAGADGLDALLHGDGRARSGCRLPFDFAAFQTNPARVTLQAIDRDSGRTVFFTRDDFPSEEELMLRVRASTSYPIIVPPTWVDGRALYDGGIGVGGGIMLPRATDDGLRRYFVVCTRPRGYRRPERPNRLYDAYFWRRPRLRAALDTWAQRYNAELDRLARLEAEGRAYVFYANDQGVANTERDERKLKANFQRGRAQAQKELPTWERFLSRS
ncbi:patatin-like phospholipase family protein [Arabiibacter massiliensis]|uniref:patatin-like phospholipase family protein n=1 Tax=Arabiibacter massiliensis TaxID=1870985 RepID=UPI0009BB563E|nr:patatin-like phospholipase family protein [Arabiibacter massiliensis]